MGWGGAAYYTRKSIIVIIRIIMREFRVDWSNFCNNKRSYESIT